MSRRGVQEAPVLYERDQTEVPKLNPGENVLEGEEHETWKINRGNRGNRDINRPNRLKKTRTDQNRIRRYLEIVNEAGRADAPTNNTFKNVLYQGDTPQVPGLPRWSSFSGKSLGSTKYRVCSSIEQYNVVLKKHSQVRCINIRLKSHNCTTRVMNIPITFLLFYSSIFPLSALMCSHPVNQSPSNAIVNSLVSEMKPHQSQLAGLTRR